MPPGGIDHQVVFVIAQLPILTYWHQSPKEWLITIGKRQHRSLEARPFKHFKGILCLFHEHYSLTLPAGTFPRYMFMQWLHYTCKPFDKSPVMPHQAQKGSDFHVSSAWSKFCHGLQILITGLHALLQDMMSQIVNLALDELALCWLELKVVLSEVLNHNGQLMQVLLFCFQKDSYIIQVY